MAKTPLGGGREMTDGEADLVDALEIAVVKFTE